MSDAQAFLDRVRTNLDQDTGMGASVLVPVGMVGATIDEARQICEAAGRLNVEVTPMDGRQYLRWGA